MKVGSKLRMRIINGTGYNKSWNCQAPKAIRIEGRVYRIDNPDVKIVTKEGQHPYYKLPNAHYRYQTVIENQIN